MAESSNNGKAKPKEIAARAAEQMQDLIGRPVESVTGLAKDGKEWTVTLEVLELQRIPSTTDVLGRYEVKLDEEGELQGAQRTRRYPRAEAGED
jgi:Gas vesicle synthesis protein GvpO